MLYRALKERKSWNVVERFFIIQSKNVQAPDFDFDNSATVIPIDYISVVNGKIVLFV